MKSYWLWLFIHIIIWMIAVSFYENPIFIETPSLIGIMFYFILFFILPLVKNSWGVLLLISTNTIIATVTLFPYNGELNFYLLLLLSVLMAEGFYRLPIKLSVINAVVSVAGFIISVLASYLSLVNSSFYLLYLFLLLVALLFYKRTQDKLTDIEARYQAVFQEYRDLKRKGITEEELARQEERVLIAHEIHDSVGHKLTALIMQLEMFRLQITEEFKDRVQGLKNLANESLSETRRAVKSLKATDTGGLPGVLRLIRKLETENMMTIHFSVKHGAFSAPLTGEQAFVIYRSVQEALTNTMKHSNAREAEIVFEAPGGSIFRFEISNPIQGKSDFQEGFGLTSMRERLEKYGGGLKVFQTKEQFLVNGFIKIINSGDEDDSNIISRGSSDGETRLKNDD